MKKIYRRAIAMLMAVLLAVGMAPIDSFLGGSVVAKAGETDQSVYTLDPNDSTTFDAVCDGDNALAANATVGTDDFFTLISTGSKIKSPTLNLSYNGKTYANSLRLDGAAKVNGQACFEITVTETAKVTILASGKNSKGSKLEYVEVGGSAFTTVSEGLVQSEIAQYSFTLEPGTYYIGSDQGCDIFNVTVQYNAVEQTQTAWSEVQTPTIDNVSLDEDGNFVVDFTAVIDQYAGAEDVQISMLENGYEVSSQKITSQKSEVTFQPLWSGNYTFVAVAQRTGEADKTSEVFTYNDYVLAVNKPTISWVQNKGNGSVYLDWVNIEDADSYAVGYKVSGSSADYTMADTQISADQGNYTLTGLTVGTTYDLIVKATRNSDDFTSTATTTVTVTSTEDQPWYIATVGSAQQTSATITTEDGDTTSYNLNSSDSTSGKSNVVSAESIANTSGSIVIQGQSSGKISDDEDGFSYYYTKIDPNTENFKLTATFTITDTSLTPDNQTGFGVVAADTLGVNNWGSVDYVHKYFNYTSSMLFSSKSTAPVMRSVTGYTSADTSNNDGVDRTVTNTKFSNTKADFTTGTSYVFSIEKTDSGYIATCNGEELSLDDNAFTSVQEDGTVCVGVMVSRKITVNVSDITFTKSESATGITSSTASDSKVQPSATIYSSDTCGSSEYTYIYQPNCAGTLTVTGPQGTVLENQSVAASEVVKVTVPVSIGSNTITATFVPTASDQITSTNTVTSTTKVDCQKYGTTGETIIVSADGSADGQGTQESPLDLATAVKYAQPGQTIYLLDGTYTKDITIKRSVSGTQENNITMVAQSDNVVFDGAGLTVIGDYWHIYGIYVKNAPGVGIQVSGNYNTIEMCTIEGAANSGLQISRSGSADNTAGIEYELWPTGNLIKNCESFDNCDAGRNDADGFAAKLTCGENNKFYGCISHNNIDDGWDLYAKSITGEIGAVTIENCVAYNNGWLTTDDTSAADYVYGEGNGFKLGGGYLEGAHVLKNSISFNNRGKGITSNSCPDCQIINCISYNNSVDENGAYNVGLNTKDSNVKAWVVQGLISIASSKDTTNADLIPFSLHSITNYIYDGSASYNNQGVQATDSWFENVDTTVAPTRNTDGSINMHGLLTLTEAAPTDTGARLDTTSTQALSIQPVMTTVVTGKQTADTDNNDQNQNDDQNNNQNENNGQDQNTGEDTNGGDTTGDNDTDEDGSEAPVVIEKTDESNVLVDAKLEADAVVLDASGNVVAAQDVTIVVTPVTQQSDITTNSQALANQSIVVNNDTTVVYYEISLQSAAGTKLTLQSGKVLLQFAYPNGTASSTYEFAVYHITADGTVETLTTSLSSSGLTVETESFSVFALAYTAKDTASTGTTDTTDTTSTTDTSSTTDTTNTTDTSTTTASSTDTTSQSVNTGDSSYASAFIMIAVIAGVIAIGACAYEVVRRKKNKIK